MKLKEGRERWNAWCDGAFRDLDFSDCDLSDMDFTGYDFSWGYFALSSCVNTSFVACQLYGAIFVETDLSGSNFTNATMGETVFSRTSLAKAEGLDTVNHQSPTSIGLDTFFMSGGLPESFLRGCGVPEEFIAYASSLVGIPIEYYSCFISYSHPDEAFARQLHQDLQLRKIRVWFAPEDLKIGDRFRARIHESIHMHDKLVLILSKHSIDSTWVEDEVERALAREVREKRDVLFPIRLDDTIFDTDKAWARGILDTCHIGNFCDNYTDALDRLVRDLKKSQPLL